MEHSQMKPVREDGRLAILRCRVATGIVRPMYASRVSAGFPSPADDYMECELDLNAHLVPNPAATFFVRVSGHSMTGAGISPGDILVVDRSLPPGDGDVVVAVVDGEFLVKRLVCAQGRLELRAENPGYRSVAVGEESDVEVWGVVRHVIHTY